MLIIFILLGLVAVWMFSFLSTANKIISMSFAFPSWWSDIDQIREKLKQKKIPDYLWIILPRPSKKNKFLFFHKMDLSEIANILLGAKLVQRKAKEDIAFNEIASQMKNIVEEVEAIIGADDDSKRFKKLTTSLNNSFCHKEISIWYYRKTPEGISGKRKILLKSMNPFASSNI